MQRRSEILLRPWVKSILFVVALRSSNPNKYKSLKAIVMNDEAFQWMSTVFFSANEILSNKNIS